MSDTSGISQVKTSVPIQAFCLIIWLKIIGEAHHARISSHTS